MNFQPGKIIFEREHFPEKKIIPMYKSYNHFVLLHLIHVFKSKKSFGLTNRNFSANTKNHILATLSKLQIKRCVSTNSQSGRQIHEGFLKDIDEHRQNSKLSLFFLLTSKLSLLTISQSIN